MDDSRFDALTRALGSSSGRRGVVHSLAAGALGALGLLSTLEALARNKPKPKPNKKKKKKKSCKAPKVKCGKLCCKAGQSCVARQCVSACQFTASPDGLTLTLQANCDTATTITDIGEGVTLDGAGKTIRFTGPVSGYEDIDSDGTSVRAGLLLQANNVTVRNLTLDQSAIGCETNRPHSAIVIESASTTLESVDIVTDVDNTLCFRGIDAETTISNQRFLADGVTITGNRRTGIAVAGPFDATIQNSRVEDCTFGIAARNLPNRVFFDANTVIANFGILMGRAGSRVTVSNNTVTGRAEGSNGIGVQFVDSGGSVTGNTISNYNCGIKLQGNALVVTGIEPNENTISGGGQAICDERVP